MDSSGPKGRVAVSRGPPHGVTMKYMATYDLMESIRNTNEWMGATARAMASLPLGAK